MILVLAVIDHCLISVESLSTCRAVAIFKNLDPNEPSGFLRLMKVSTSNWWPTSSYDICMTGALLLNMLCYNNRPSVSNKILCSHVLCCKNIFYGHELGYIGLPYIGLHSFPVSRLSRDIAWIKKLYKNMYKESICAQHKSIH